MATNYFNETMFYSPSANFPLSTQYAGLNSSGYVFNASVCFPMDHTDLSGNYDYCTITNWGFYSINEIYNDNWNNLNPASSGTLGLGISSPAW